MRSDTIAVQALDTRATGYFPSWKTTCQLHWAHGQACS
jgi:hypothetical protein